MMKSGENIFEIRIWVIGREKVKERIEFEGGSGPKPVKGGFDLYCSSSFSKEPSAHSPVLQTLAPHRHLTCRRSSSSPASSLLRPASPEQNVSPLWRRRPTCPPRLLLSRDTAPTGSTSARRCSVPATVTPNSSPHHRAKLCHDRTRTRFAQRRPCSARADPQQLALPLQPVPLSRPNRDPLLVSPVRPPPSDVRTRAASTSVPARCSSCRRAVARLLGCRRLLQPRLAAHPFSEICATAATTPTSSSASLLVEIPAAVGPDPKLSLPSRPRCDPTTLLP
ncbi:hypothetical protein EUGRSUZ_B02010 [Eucalyptus grandis]|uniref:Uncharacterized protein n=2 Tax=Eucalyptus grandis TaxID=71139 RepID=A0ACC3LS42_EUCGR|nr:hypothetical protein EUGRSUZ_B02010 [Eucalyptus grandis]